MADVTEAQQRFRDYAGRVLDDALDGMRKRLLEAAPVGEPDPLGRSRGGDRLIDTYFQQSVFQAGGSLACTVGFYAASATFSNDLMPPHVIRSRGRYPLRFWWEDGPEGPGEYRYMKVNHPGNVNSRSLGWFDKTATSDNWGYEVELATRAVTY